MRFNMLSSIKTIESAEDREFLDRLYRAHYPRLHKAAWAILLDDEEAGAVVTTAMMSLFSLVDKLRLMEPEALMGYLKRTVRNAAFKRYNARKHRNLTEIMGLDQLYALPGTETDDPAHVILQAEEHDTVRAAILQLSGRDRLLVFLKYSAGLSAREISELTNAPSEEAVHMRLSRVRHRLLQTLVEWGWEHG